MVQEMDGQCMGSMGCLLLLAVPIDRNYWCDDAKCQTKSRLSRRTSSKVENSTKYNQQYYYK